MNLLPPDQLAALEKCFGEGRGVRETARLTGVPRDTVSRYFRLLRDPAPTAIEDVGGGAGDAHFAVIDHADDWHVFYIHNDTPEWWRHIATFHNEERARLYAEDCEGWLTVISVEKQKDIADTGHPLPDEVIAPATLPEPPAISAAPILTREKRAVERESQWDEIAAALPDRAGRNSKRASAANGAADEQSAEKPTDSAEQERLPKAHEIVSQFMANAEGEEPPAMPPVHKDCPDQTQSVPIKDFADHRRLDH
jgi:hypothetical protein